MAEGILKHFHGRRIYVDSVGVRESEVDPFAVVVMDEIGIDISRHRSKTFDDLEDGSFDLIITLSPEAQHRAVELTRTMACEIEFWHTLDPTIFEGNRETRLNAYRQVRDTLMERIMARFPVPPAPSL
jgi:protein-tyrosine-phosphatase